MGGTTGTPDAFCLRAVNEWWCGSKKENSANPSESRIDFLKSDIQQFLAISLIANRHYKLLLFLFYFILLFYPFLARLDRYHRRYNRVRS